MEKDNSEPSRSGIYCINGEGIMSYFPIEQAGNMRPALALVIREKPDGTVSTKIDIVWPRVLNEEETK